MFRQVHAATMPQTFDTQIEQTRELKTIYQQKEM
jgi:hypothetical protein